LPKPIHYNNYRITDSESPALVAIYRSTIWRLFQHQQFLWFRQTAKRECKLLEEFFEKYFATELPYKVDSRLQDNLEMEHDTINLKISKKEKKQKKIKKSTEEKVSRFKRKKEKLQIEIAELQERADTEKVS